jgi:hypothetical protein
MIKANGHHGTSKDTDPGRDRAIVIAHQHPEKRRAEQIDDAADPLGGPADWRDSMLKTLGGHRSSISTTTAAYIYSSPNYLKAAVELA